MDAVPDIGSGHGARGWRWRAGRSATAQVAVAAILAGGLVVFGATVASHAAPAVPAAVLPSAAPASAAAIAAHEADVRLGLRDGSPSTATVSGANEPLPAVVDGSVARTSSTTTANVVSSVAGLPEPSSPMRLPSSGGGGGIVSAPVASNAPPPSGTTGKARPALDPSKSVEIVSKRDAVTTVYQNSDGTQSVHVSSMPVHYQDGAGSWQNIDNHIVSDGSGGFVNGPNGFKVSFKSMTPGRGVTVTATDGSLTFVAKNTNPAVKPVLSSDGLTVTYPEIVPGSDLTYTVTGNASAGWECCQFGSTPMVTSEVVDSITESDVDEDDKTASDASGTANPVVASLAENTCAEATTGRPFAS